MSIYRSPSAPTCNRCGSDLAGRLAREIDSNRNGKRCTTYIYRCRCGGSRRIRRRAREVAK